jgi:Arc/MetJ-type ribon-helix-helix transcriptional regulator
LRNEEHTPVQPNRRKFNYNQQHAMAQPRGADTPQTVRLPAELLERIDRYAARLESELHLSVSRSDALRRLLSLALEDAEDTADAEAILRANEPRVSWEELKAGSASPTQAHES